MASNYQVSVGGFADPTSSLRESLGTLSRDFARKAADEKEAARLALATEESKRRYDLDRQDSLDSAQRQANQWQTDFDAQREDAKRAEDQRQYLRDIAQKEFDYKKQDRQREEDEREARTLLDQALYSGDLSKMNFTKTDYRPEMQQVFDRQYALIDNVESGLVNELINTGKANYAPVVANYRQLLDKTNLTDEKVDNLTAQFESDIIRLKDLQSLSDMTPEEQRVEAERIAAERFNPLRESIDLGIQQGEGMLREGRIAAFMRQAAPKIRNNLLMSEVDTAIGTNLDAQSRASLLAAEKDRVEALNESEKEQYERTKDYYKLLQDKKTSSGKLTADDVIKGYKALGIEGPNAERIGSFDMQDVKEGFDYLVSQGYSPDLVASVMYGNVEEGIIDDTFPEVGSTAFADMEQTIANLSNVTKRGTNGNSRIDAKNFQYKPAVSRDLLDLQLNNFRIPGNDNYELDVPELVPNTTEVARRVLTEPQTQVTPNTPSTPVPVEVLRPQSEYYTPEEELAIRNNPNVMTDIAENGYRNLLDPSMTGSEQLALGMRAGYRDPKNNANLDDPLAYTIGSALGALPGTIRTMSNNDPNAGDEFAFEDPNVVARNIAEADQIARSGNFNALTPSMAKLLLASKNYPTGMVNILTRIANQD
jgi:hypothetical protein